MNAAASKIFYAACKIFQTYEKLSSTMVDLDSQQSHLTWLQDQPGATANPAEEDGKSSPLYHLPGDYQRAWQSWEIVWAEHKRHSYIVVRCYPLKEPAFPTRKPISWNTFKQLQ